MHLPQSKDQPALRLRPMTPADVDAVCALDQAAFGESAWSRRQFVAELTESRISVFYVLLEEIGAGEDGEAGGDGELIGYFGTWHILEQLQLCTFAISPARHGEGLGGLLLACVLRLAARLECSVVQLEVRVSNQAARGLYRSRGFAEDGRRRNLYTDPKEDGILMSLPLPPPVQPPQRWQGTLRLAWSDWCGKLDEVWDTAGLHCAHELE